MSRDRVRYQILLFLLIFVNVNVLTAFQTPGWALAAVCAVELLGGFGALYVVGRGSSRR